MSNWTHALTVIVPESLIAKANQLALVIGTSEDDVNTFRQADWTDGASNYAVAHTQAVDQIIGYFSLVPADLSANVVFPVDGITGGDMTKIQVFVDQDPFYVLYLLGLVRV